MSERGPVLEAGIVLLVMIGFGGWLVVSIMGDHEKRIMALERSAAGAQVAP